MGWDSEGWGGAVRDEVCCPHLEEVCVWVGLKLGHTRLQFRESDRHCVGPWSGSLLGYLSSTWTHTLALRHV